MYDSVIPSIHEIHQSIKSGVKSPEIIFNKAQENILAIDGELNSFVRLTELDKSFSSADTESVIYGIPFSVKDIIDTAGITTEYGSKFFSGHVPSEDARVVQLLKKAGGLMQGKTNTHELAMGIVTPQCSNPWDNSRITGGSSGGSAASVAAGLSIYSIGTDTAGSIRIPASMCGVSGLKPTTGSLSLKGILPEAWSLDTVGPITRYASDIPGILRAMGFSSRTPNLKKERPKVGIIKNILEKSDQGVSNAFRSFIDKVTSEDLVIAEECSINDLEDIAIKDDIIDGCESATFHRNRFLNHPELFSEQTKSQIEYYYNLRPMDYIEAQRMRVEKTIEFNGILQKYDFLLSPTIPSIAPMKEELRDVNFEFFMKYMEFTNPFNLTGLPAISIPCGFSNGLPVGLQIVGSRYDDINLCEMASEFQKVSDYHLRMPQACEKIDYGWAVE